MSSFSKWPVYAYPVNVISLPMYAYYAGVSFDSLKYDALYININDVTDYDFAKQLGK